MKLYEIDDRIRDIMERSEDGEGCFIDPDTGELLSADEALEGLHMEREHLLEHVALCIKERNALIAEIKEEEKRLKMRRMIEENAVARAERFLTNALTGPMESHIGSQRRAVMQNSGVLRWYRSTKNEIFPRASCARRSQWSRTR